MRINQFVKPRYKYNLRCRERTTCKKIKKIAYFFKKRLDNRIFMRYNVCILVVNPYKSNKNILKGHKIMKKILSFALALLMMVTCVACFASCGDSVKAVKVIEVKLTEEEYAFAVQKGDTELLNQLNAFMAEIKANGKFDEIVNKYFGDGTPSAVTSAATMKTDGSQLIVATNAAFAPFEYKEGVNYYGVDMEIMAAFAAHLGKELYINDMNFDAVCLSVSAQGGTYEDENGAEVTVTGGICDIAAAGLTVSEKRMEILDFSTPYYDASQMIIVPENDTTFALSSPLTIPSFSMPKKREPPKPLAKALILFSQLLGFFSSKFSLK